MSNDIVIIGGGVIGLASAYYAAKAGHRVTVIDRESADHPGCSHRNAGMVVPSHFTPLAAPGMVALGLKWMWNPESPFHIKPRLDGDLISWAYRFWRAATPARVRAAAPVLRDLSLASRAEFESLAALPGGDFGLERKGLLMLCKTSHALDEEAGGAAKARDLGIPADVLDARQTAALEPDVRMDIAGAVCYPLDCHLTPHRFLGVLRAWLEEMKVDIRWNTEVTGWRMDGTRIAAVRTGDGDLSADEYVLCGGSWSPSIARDLRMRIPLQAGKGYGITLPQPRQLLQHCAILTEARVAVTAMDGALRVGGTMEIAGLDETINQRRVNGIIKSVPEYFPDFRTDDFAGLEPWVGLRPCPPDGLPYLGRTAAYPNLTLATGHAMMGLSLAPVTGKLIAEILSGQAPSIDLSLFSPDRYA